MNSTECVSLTADPAAMAMLVLMATAVIAEKVLAICVACSWLTIPGLKQIMPWSLKLAVVPWSVKLADVLLISGVDTPRPTG